MAKRIPTPATFITSVERDNPEGEGVGVAEAKGVPEDKPEASVAAAATVGLVDPDTEAVGLAVGLAVGVPDAVGPGVLKGRIVLNLRGVGVGVGAMVLSFGTC